jgi:hypothetical protein
VNSDEHELSVHDTRERSTEHGSVLTLGYPSIPTAIRVSCFSPSFTARLAAAGIVDVALITS